MSGTPLREDMAARIRNAAGHTTNSDAPARFDRADLEERTLFGYDQSLSDCGWMIMRHTEEELRVLAHGTISWPHGVKGQDQKLAAARALYGQMLPLMRGFLVDYPEIEAVGEAPPLGGGKLASPESSWAAAVAVECAALQVGMPLRKVVQIATHKRLLTGNYRADKKLTAICLGLLATSLPIAGWPKSTNHNVRDAASVILADLHGGS